MKTSTFFSGSVAMIAALLGAIMACGDSSDDDAGARKAEQDRQQAREFYVSRVHNAVATCVGCHSGSSSGARFMDADPEISYETIEKTAGLIAAPKNSPLVQYIHKNPSIVINPAQRSVVTQWLSLEATARGLEGAVDKPTTITEAYKQFADCMNFDVWSYFRMGDLSFVQTDAEGPCLGCHSTGQGNAYLAPGARETFEKHKQFPYIQKIVVGKLDKRGSFESLQPSKRYLEKANEVCPPESKTCHPRFGIPPNVMDSIDGFVAHTISALATGTCAQSIVVPVTDAGIMDAGGN